VSDADSPVRVVSRRGNLQIDGRRTRDRRSSRGHRRQDCLPHADGSFRLSPRRRGEDKGEGFEFGQFSIESTLTLPSPFEGEATKKQHICEQSLNVAV